MPDVIHKVIESMMNKGNGDDAWVRDDDFRKALSDGMVRNGIDADDDDFIEAITNGGNKRLRGVGMISPLEISCACDVWGKSGNKYYTFVVSRLLTDMRMSSIRHYDDIYREYIVQYIDDFSNMIPQDECFSTTLENYMDYNNHRISYRHLLCRGSAMYIIFSAMKVKFKDKGADYLHTIGYDMAYRMNTLVNSGISDAYHIRIKDAWEILYQLDDDRASVQWFIELIKKLSTSGRVLFKEHIDAAWIRRNSEYPVEFITESPLNNDIGISDYKQKAFDLLSSLNRMTRPSNSTHECPKDELCHYNTYDSVSSNNDHTLDVMLQHPLVLSSVKDMIGIDDDFRKKSTHEINRIYGIMDDMERVPSIVWKAMSGSIPDEYTNNGCFVYRIDCPGNLDILYPRNIISGFDIHSLLHDQSLKVPSTYALNNAKRILDLHDNDALYRWAVWTHVCNAIRYRKNTWLPSAYYRYSYNHHLVQANEDLQDLIDTLSWQYNKKIPVEAWQYVKYGTLPRKISYPISNGTYKHIVLNEDVLGYVFDQLATIPLTIQGALMKTDENHICAYIDDILDTNHHDDSNYTDMALKENPFDIMSAFTVD